MITHRRKASLQSLKDLTRLPTSNLCRANINQKEEIFDRPSVFPLRYMVHLYMDEQVKLALMKLLPSDLV